MLKLRTLERTTMVELLDAVYRYHGWKRNFGESRVQRVKEKYKLSVDYSKNRFIATPKKDVQ